MSKKKRGNYKTKNVILLSNVIKDKDVEVEKEKKNTTKDGDA